MCVIQEGIRLTYFKAAANEAETQTLVQCEKWHVAILITALLSRIDGNRTCVAEGGFGDWGGGGMWLYTKSMVQSKNKTAADIRFNLFQTSGC